MSPTAAALKTVHIEDARANVRARASQARPTIDQDRLERAVREMLCAIGEDPDRDGLRETPRRVAKAYREILSGMYEDPADHLGRVFEHRSGGDDLVMVRDIEFFSLCEHHLLPFSGSASVVYLPEEGRVVGLSKIARTVDAFARRPQLQERLTAEIADALMDRLGARGVAVIARAEHMCMKMRGISKHSADMVTSAFRGLFERSDALRTQALSLLRPHSPWG